jgi:hypothetical protein
MCLGMGCLRSFRPCLERFACTVVAFHPTHERRFWHLIAAYDVSHAEVSVRVKLTGVVSCVQIVFTALDGLWYTTHVVRILPVCGLVAYTYRIRITFLFFKGRSHMYCISTCSINQERFQWTIISGYCHFTELCWFLLMGIKTCILSSSKRQY